MPAGIWLGTGSPPLGPFGHNRLGGPLRLRRSREHTPDGSVMTRVELSWDRFRHDELSRHLVRRRRPGCTALDFDGNDSAPDLLGSKVAWHLVVMPRSGIGWPPSTVPAHFRAPSQSREPWRPYPCRRTLRSRPGRESWPRTGHRSRVQSSPRTRFGTYVRFPLVAPRSQPNVPRSAGILLVAPCSQHNQELTKNTAMVAAAIEPMRTVASITAPAKASNRSMASLPRAPYGTLEPVNFSSWVGGSDSTLEWIGRQS